MTNMTSSMKQSELFTRTKKSAPSDEVAKNAEYLIRGGFIHKEMAGAYDYLPLGLKVIEKIKNIIREEMNAIGGEEIIMTTLQRKELWEKTDRWNDENVDVWFKSELKSGTELGFGWSHEEPITDMMRDFISSYRDLPVYVYQFQTKLRNELRAKSGILRGREFLMKDMYSYSLNEEAHDKFYKRATEAYMKVFKRVGLGHLTYLTFASGGAFTKFSHEFQTLLPNGEDTIYLHKDKNIAVNKEVLTDEVLKDLEMKREELVERTSSEVGNIFNFGSAKSEQLGLYFKDETGQDQPVILGSYGIGISRLLGVIVEALSDDKGIIWPEAVAPFQVHLLVLGEDEKVKQEADLAYEELKSKNIEVLFDDRISVSAGEKFADADLLGLPYRVVVSERSMKEGGVEVKKRIEEKGEIMAVSDLIKSLM